MNARPNRNGWLYDDLDSVSSFTIRHTIETIVNQFPKGYRARTFTVRVTKRLLRDALRSESPALLLEETGEIMLAAARAGVPRQVLVTFSYEQIVKATLVEARKAPGFKPGELYCQD